MRKLTKDDVTICVNCFSEEIPIRGNVSAIDEEAIRKDLESGNTWAWCMICVTVTWETFYGTDWLGACSYASKKEFEVSVVYDDMVAAALEELNVKIKEMARWIDSLK